ncbi:ecdysone oxidase [Bombyx mori]|uniref:Glucose-methanol-choline oxidoreductase N-terminal domain-containing protein n=1 Tax=Bombyx mori TaxID=7091 RepID=A0A8R2M1I2_BOMMO|nr:glucose dehydrogenase [FAD, quinone] [Bombyx mori]XP_012551834.1 glucose dehydrogenase [FAD, quinone] [Bombyx mori]XP_037871223.1 glucose dehydrogenase [FAD, quinone] [Bombyx mori]XP_037871224.1 glucose dehydrogenase [FAD, quinone] [Bombyx mori]
MISLNTVANEFFKILQASQSSWLVRWLLNALALSQAIQPNGWPENYKPLDGERFNFIVVGSGSAGAIVATRLSEVPHWTVLLIEAGGDPPPTSVVPSLFATLSNTEYDWSYKAYLDEGVGETHPGRAIFMTRGKMLGGSSSNNYEIYTRGVPQDYEEWNLEAPGWDWNTCLYYFKKLENMTDISLFQNPYNAHLHSTNGPVAVSRPEDNAYSLKINEVMLKSYEELGIRRVLENNGPEIEGISRPHFTFANGRRSSTAESYLRPTKGRPNLFIAKYARVVKILLDPYTRTTYGVKVMLQDGNVINLFADSEVILSAGTIDSPKLLMLSGIGPHEVLQKHDIDTIVNLPVGKNMQDHAYAPILFTGKAGLSSIIPNLVLATQLDSFPIPIQSGFFSLGGSVSQSKPDFQIFSQNIGASASVLIRYGCSAITNYNDEFCYSLAKPNNIREIILASVLLLHPYSRGQVSLRSNNPLDDPIIELGYFRDDFDLHKLTEGLKFISNLVNTSYLRKVNGTIPKLAVSPCKEFVWGSDDYWTCYVRNVAGSLLHPVGTCKMGADGVVDERLNVHSVKGLRVVDASVMPKIPSANINAPTMMIGEHASDLIKEDYGVFSR